MPILPGYDISFGGGGGGGGLTLGPAPNTFTAATRAAAEALRDAAATGITGTLLAQYDAEPTFTITLNWPAVPTNTVYQARRSGAWADVTGLVRGPRGAEGDQARFMVYAYINAAVAPAVAPVGGTFTLSTGTLVVPANYAAIPSTPPAGSRTYRTEAMVNPATAATDAINLVWSVPAELPAYLSARLALTAQQAAEAARDAAERFANTAQDIAVGSPKGDIWATSPVLAVASRSTNSEYPFAASAGWDLTAEGLAAGLSDPGNGEENLPLPGKAPPGVNGYWYEVLVGDVVVGDLMYPFGQRYGSRTFPTIARVFAGVSGTTDLYINLDYRDGEVSIYGGGNVLLANTRVRIRAAVVRGDPGQGPGGGLSQAQVQALIDATSLSSLQGMVTNSQIPDTITRDAELTAALAPLAARVAVLEAFHSGGGDHTRYATGIAAAAAMPTEAQWLAGATSTTDEIDFPITGMSHKKCFAVPATEDSLTVIRPTASPINTRASYSPAVGADDVIQSINGVDHKIYVQNAADFATLIITPFTLRSG